MKKKFLAWSLLFSFFWVIAHNVIPHHHHDSAINDHTIDNTHCHGHAHQDSSHHHDKGDSDNSALPSHDHSHNFPEHNHLDGHSFDIARLSSTLLEDNMQSLKIFLFSIQLPQNVTNQTKGNQIKYWIAKNNFPLPPLKGGQALRAPPNMPHA